VVVSTDVAARAGWRSWLADYLQGERLRKLLVNAGFLLVVVFLGTHHPRLSYLFARDAHAYWTVDLANPYAKTVGQTDAYLYSPAFAQLIEPLAALPFPLFYALITAVNVAALVYLLGRLRAVVALVALSPAAIDIWYGNIHLLMAVAIVLGFRYPAAWSLLLLTKITPGVGILWFAARREWRLLAVALGSTALIAAVSFLLAPGLWHDWVDQLQRNAARPPQFGVFQDAPLRLRLIPAVLLVVWGALTNRAWTVPVAATLALPVLWFNGLAMLAAAMWLIDPPRVKDAPGPADQPAADRGSPSDGSERRDHGVGAEARTSG